MVRTGVYFRSPFKTYIEKLHYGYLEKQLLIGYFATKKEDQFGNSN